VRSEPTPASSHHLLSPRERLERSLVHVPEGKPLFPRMTVRENLTMGAFLRGDSPAIRPDIDAMFARFPILHARQGQRAGSLSGGEQRSSPSPAASWLGRSCCWWLS
jgi:ABC-type branched-subunit amino acid transport system ATPase component